MDGVLGVFLGGGIYTWCSFVMAFGIVYLLHVHFTCVFVTIHFAFSIDSSGSNDEYKLCSKASLISPEIMRIIRRKPSCWDLPSGKEQVLSPFAALLWLIKSGYATIREDGDCQRHHHLVGASLHCVVGAPFGDG